MLKSFLVNRIKLLQLPPRIFNAKFCTTHHLTSHIDSKFNKLQIENYKSTYLNSSIFVRNFNSSSDEGFFRRILTRIGFTKTEYSKSLLHMAGTVLFVKVADEVNYLKFFEGCNMEDTFASWFIVMELHVWLIACRLMQEGPEGKIVRNSMLKAMWKDIDVRAKKLEGALSSARRIQTKELGEQFTTQLVSYDEGLHGKDKVLAGALWRRFLQHRPPKSQRELVKQIESLEMLVAYTRSQFAKLHTISKKDIILNHKIQWSPFDKSILTETISTS